MTNHKIKLTETEMELVKSAIGKLLWHLEDEMRPWVDFDEEPPEYMQEDFEKISKLYNKLTDPF